MTRTYPRGLDTEAFTVSALEEAQQSATDSWDREHVTPFLYRHPERFALRDVRDARDRSELRWTVDTPEDFDLVTRIYAELWEPQRPVFEYDEILGCLTEHPDWVRINQHVVQKQR
jgi:spore coat polysaccharide biosynthesis protein SpsF